MNPPHVRSVLRRRNVLAFVALVLVCLGAGVAFVTAADGEDTAALHRKVRESFEAGDMKAALAAADQAVAGDPTNPQVYLLRATVRELMRDFDKVVEDCDRLIELEPANALAYQRRGAANFRAGHVEASIRDFDKFIELEPREEPYHWQRGLSYYYAGRFADGRKQFELHQTVNSSDVENAAWHYLCVARLEGVEAARKALIPISGDSRVPMKEVHALFGGKGTPEAVLAAARAGGDEVPAEKRKDQEFYAHLYLGLYYEAAGESAKAREHIDLAAGEFAQTHYMGDVARVHAARLREADKPKADQPAAHEPGAKPAHPDAQPK